MSTAIESSTSEPSFYSRKGVASWLLTTDHKRISILYLSSMMTFFLVGMTLGLFMVRKIRRAFTKSVVKVRCRPRMTHHGGATKTAVGDE